MAKLSHQKLKLLYIMKILLEKTDEEHTITVNKIIMELKSLGISAARKSVYEDLELLKLFGLDIEKRKTKTHDYYIASREFQLPELKLLVDSIQASKFITHKKSMELIKKIETLTSKYNANNMQRQVFVYNRVKSMNESIYYNVDRLHEAISKNKMISFKYYDWSVNKEKVFRKNGGEYIANPISLCVDSENYYLIVYSDKWSDFVHYRVDKMVDIKLLDENRILPEDEFDLAKYVKPVFSMFDGEITEVSLKFHNSLAGIVIDRFGKDVVIIKPDDENFIAKITVAISPIFFSWVIGFGNHAKIISPEWVADEVCKLAYAAIEQYEECNENE